MTESPARTCVLFDIDGTLLDLHGSGKRAFALAIEEVFGWADDIAYIRFAGATDLDVLHQIARRHGRDLRDGEADRFFAALPRKLRQTAAEAGVTVYPGAAELVSALSAHPLVTIGLVTGNIEETAHIKLARAGLHGHFVLGAFGHEHGDRREIARLALARAAATLPPDTTFARTFLIGDTPSDIAAARHIGAIAIGVTTGQHTAELLREAGADHVLDGLTDALSILLP